MQIFYDGEIYIRQSLGGINRYFYNLISRLPSEYEPIITSLKSYENNLPSHPNLTLHSYNRFGIKPGRLSFALEPYYFGLLEKVSNYQIFHPTYHYLLTREKLRKRKKPIVLTVYDLLQEVLPELIDPTGKETDFKKSAILAADVIICISESTKRDLLHYYPVSEEKVFVTHLATELNISLNSESPLPPSPYILYVGSRHGHKNFDRLLLAFSNLIKKDTNIKLCVVSHPFSDEENKRIFSLHLNEHIHLISWVDDSYLVKLYKNCLCFVYPSLYEGFGIPPLEAMICQAPVIASNTSSIPEVVGDAGLLFNPLSTDELTDRLLFLLDNSIVRQNLITRGLQQVKKFSWDKTVQQTVSIYNSLV
ncbi:MAG TPA: glycosyltransferase family 1 protein [Nodularia sp. (in: cyanobacteria)]|nr:glycosyltransferase family 1 protein [Nodularia sp. (in: cyanobacteria)]